MEDDGQVAALVTDMLRDLGYDVLHASNAEAALGALADARHVDFVFSDIMMPGGTSGLELARAIRERRPRLPILLTSGFPRTAASRPRTWASRCWPSPMD